MMQRPTAPGFKPAATTINVPRPVRPESSRMLRFAANLSLMYNELPFLDRFGAAADDGFEAVE